MKLKLKFCSNYIISIPLGFKYSLVFINYTSIYNFNLYSFNTKVT